MMIKCNRCGKVVCILETKDMKINVLVCPTCGCNIKEIITEGSPNGMAVVC